jgi:hypothetical protein
MILGFSTRDVMVASSKGDFKQGWWNYRAGEQLQHYFPWKATQMNYQTKYLEDNAITKEYPNFPKLFVCFFCHKLALRNLPFLKTNFTDFCLWLCKCVKRNRKSTIRRKLIKYSDSTTTQIVVITIESLQNEDVSQLTTKWRTNMGHWRHSEDDNGVIILLAKAEKK